MEVRTGSQFSPILSITKDGVEVPFRMLTRRLFEIGDAASGGIGIVRYKDGILTDRLFISGPEGSFVIPFRVRKKEFELNGRRYRLGTLVGGHVRIWDGPSLAVEGQVFLHGVRLDSVSDALRPFACELAFGLALKIGAGQPPFPPV